MDLGRGHFLVKMYAKTKELGPIGGRVPGTPPPRSANALIMVQCILIEICQLPIACPNNRTGQLDLVVSLGFVKIITRIYNSVSPRARDGRLTVTNEFLFLEF